MQRWRRSECRILRQTPAPSASVTGTGHRRHREAAGTVLSDGPGEAKIESSWQIEGGSRWRGSRRCFGGCNQSDSSPNLGVELPPRPGGGEDNLGNLALLNAEIRGLGHFRPWGPPGEGGSGATISARGATGDFCARVFLCNPSPPAMK